MKNTPKVQFVRLINYALFSFLLLILLTDCKKEYDCDKANLIFSFLEKTPDSLSSFVIYKFDKSNAIQPIDSVEIVNGGGVYFQVDGNSTNVFFPPSLLVIDGTYNWKLKVNSARIEAGQSAVFINDITEKAETMKCKKKDFSTAANGCQCMNTLQSYVKNGIATSTTTKLEYKGILGYKVVINP